MAVKTSAVGILALYLEVVSAGLLNGIERMGLGKFYNQNEIWVACVTGYYCDSDKCSDDEYCCGYNLCCKSYKVWDMWYFWCGLLFFLFLLSMCGCIWKLRSRSPLLIGGYTYTRVEQEPTYIRTCPAAAPAMMSQGPPSFSDHPGHPPMYAHPQTFHSKPPSPPPAYAQVVAERDAQYGH